MTAFLQVDRAEFLEGLKSMRRYTRKRSVAQVVISHCEGQLVMEMPGVAATATATGEWPGIAAVPWQFFLPLVKVPPRSDPVPFRVAEGRLTVDTFSAPCSWTPHEPSHVRLPINAPLWCILRLGFEHTYEEIDRSGLKWLYVKALNERDAIVRKAARLLEPLQVTEEALGSLVDECVQKAEAK